MYSRFRSSVLFAGLIGALALAGCDREARDARGKPFPENGPATTPLTNLQPGASTPPPSDPRGKLYEGNAFHVGQGQRLFKWMNCNGCHALGGGGMGPALMDDQWRYGGSIDQIYATIVQGRPNGMPSFNGKIPDAQIWELAAYVRSLSGNVPKDVAPSRDEGISATPPLTQTPRQPPKSDPAAVQSQPR